MRLFTFVATALLALSSNAHAGTGKLTVQRCLEINAALVSLDSYERDGKKQFYKFSIDTRRAIAHNLTALRDIKAAFDAEQNALLMEASNGEGRFQTRINPNTQELELTPGGQAQNAKFTIGVRKALDSEQEVTFAKIKIGDLLKDENPIPPTTISILAPLLED
jgi:hypothetical protein